MLQNNWLYQLELPIDIVTIIHNFYYRKDNYPFWYKANVNHFLQIDNIHHEIMIWNSSFPKMKPKSLRKYPRLVMGGYKLYPDMYESPPLYVQTKILQPNNYLCQKNISSWIDQDLYHSLALETKN